MKKSALLFLLALMPAASWCGAKKINVQGRLTNASGTPLAGSQTVTFRLYDVSTAAVSSAVWVDTMTVTLSSGAFNAMLGSGASLDALAFDKTYYLGLKVSGDADEMSPRQVLAAAPYALGSAGDFHAAGRLGVGTGSPQYTLHVKGNDGVAGWAAKMESSHTTNDGVLLLGSRANDSGAIQSTDVAGVVKPLLLNPDGGNVGIGTTSPAYKLDVAGTLRADNVSPSDRNLKKDIRPYPAGVSAKVLSLNAATFRWKAEKGYSTDLQAGLIAQDVEAVFPEVVRTDPDGLKSISYMGVTAILLQAVKEQAAEIEALKSRLTQLEKK